MNHLAMLTIGRSLRGERVRRVTMLVAPAMALAICASNVLAAGTFGSKTFYASGRDPYRLGVADVDGDGHADLVVPNCGSSFISVLWNKGNGTFKSAVHLAVGAGSCPSSVAFGDFNGHGDVDLAVALYNPGKVAILLNKGNRAFKKPKRYAAGSGPSPIAVADFNADTKLDLAVAAFGSDAVVILKGLGGGAFAAPSGKRTVGHNPDFLLAKDLTRDGLLDLVTANHGAASMSLLAGHGNGTFAAARTLAVGHMPNGLAIGDFNKDGVTDLATANLGDNTVSLVLGRPNGTFHGQVVFNLGSHTGASGLAAGDFNGDHKLDLAVGEHVAGRVALLFGDGMGSFALPATTYAAGTAPEYVAAAKLNADQRPDLVVANRKSNGGATVLLNH